MTPTATASAAHRQTSAPLSAQLVLRLTDDEHDALVRRAVADDRPVATYARRVLRAHLADDAQEAQAA